MARRRPATPGALRRACGRESDRKSTRLNSSHLVISYAVFCLKKKKRYAVYYCDYDNWHTACYRHSYPFGLMLNADGKRSVDKVADFRNYTYAIYSRAVLEQLG